MRGARVAVSLGLAACLAGQVPTIRVPVRLVSLPTLVFSGENRLVPGLQTGDFRVFDNGRPQSFTLDTTSTPVSVAVAVQVNQDVREYVPFIARVGSVLDALVAGEAGETAVLSYGADVDTIKPFGAGDVRAALAKISAHGRQARMIDAGLGAIAMLKERQVAHSRVLLFIGQPMDHGSESNMEALRQQAERENVAVYAVTLPEFNKAFVSDTFYLQGLSSQSDRGGFKAGVDLGKLIPTIGRSGAAQAATDPFSILTAATGGMQFHIRKQRELESALAAMGVSLRSAYVLSFTPGGTEEGYHNVSVEVNVPGAKAYTRPGYWLQ
ncbi:MAG TPA: VWA domain-containing protein [Candidatus Acidoferrales bacterium]|jgi:VWFA-related protein|nr:VWA domain-containing protein [Candidatus Acidoferrales bacterium]